MASGTFPPGSTALPGYTGAVPGYKVTPEELTAAAGFIENRAAEIEAKIAALGVYVQSLNEYWQGSAHQAFETLMADYNIYARMLHNALTDVVGGLRGNYVNYVASEQANIANIRKVDLPPAKF